MAVTAITDIVEPSAVTNYMAENIPEKLIMLQDSGVLTTPPEEVSSQFLAGGMTIDMPYWDDLTRGEADIPDDTDNAITPQKIKADETTATKQILAKAFGSKDLAGIVATGDAEDPVRRIGDRLNAWKGSETENRIIKTLTGVFADNAANDSSDMIATVYSDVASPTSSNKISTPAINEAALTIGEQMEDFRAIMVHTHVYNTLKNNEEITFHRPSETPMKVPMYGDLMVFFSDKMPVVAGTNSPKYTCYLMGKNCLGFLNHMGTNPTPFGTESLEKWRDPNTGNGGGETRLILRWRQLIHPLGLSWLKASQAKKAAPTWAELALAANWDRLYDRSNIRMAALEVNV